MPDPVTATVVGGASLIGGVSKSRAAGKAAKAQERAADQSIALQREQFNKQLELLEPFRAAGVDVGLSGLTGLASQEGQAKFYEDYYKSPQFAAQAGQARNQQLAASEATGGLGATSTQNQLARIAPTLGLQALGQQQNLYGQLTNIGLSGAGSQAGYAGNFAAGASQQLGQIGAAQAGAHLARGQAIGDVANTVGGIGLGHAYGLF